MWAKKEDEFGRKEMKDISTPTYKSENYNGKDIYYMKSTHDDK